MAKEKPKTVVPKLRFPEFRDDAKWEEKKLGSQATFHKGRGISKAEINPKGSRPCIRYGELYTRYGEVIREVVSRTNSPDIGLFLSCKNDVIIPASGETKEDIATAACVLLDDVALGSDLNVIRTNHNGVFLSYILNGPKRCEIAKVAQGDTVVHLYPSQLEQLLIAIPETHEQQKIADCLTSFDEVIAAQGRKVEALKTYKRGLMQLLFPREGETVPRLRFPEFKNAPEWKKSVLGSVCKMQAGKFVEASAISEVRESGRFPCYGGNGHRGFTKTYTHSGRYPLIGRQGALCGNVKFAEGEFHATEHAIVSTPNDGISVDWLFCALGYLQLNRFATGQAQPGLSVEVLEKVELKVPISEHEQQRVADCFSSIDSRISLEENAFSELKRHKLALMQQLFPSVEDAK